MMDSQEFGRRSSWILQGNINCHLEYCKILLVNSLIFPDTIARRQTVLHEKKLMAFMLRLHVHKNAYGTNFQVLLCIYSVLEYLKQTHLKIVYILNKLCSLRSNSHSVSFYFSACSVHYIFVS